MSKEMTREAMIEKIAELEAQTARLKAEARAKLNIKVSAKGGISIYGLGRFPVTLYRSQWERILDNADSMRVFISNHESELATKDGE